MGVEETKHDLLLRRISVTLAILASLCAVVLGIYNLRKTFFSKNSSEDIPKKSVSQAPAADSPIRSALEEAGASWIKNLGKSKTDTGQK